MSSGNSFQKHLSNELLGEIQRYPFKVGLPKEKFLIYSNTLKFTHKKEENRLDGELQFQAQWGRTSEELGHKFLVKCTFKGDSNPLQIVLDYCQ